MKTKQLLFHFVSLSVVLAATAYPVYMGVTTLLAYKYQGFVEAAAYPKYLIPYAPLSVALIMVVALMPFVYGLFRKYSLPILSLAGTVVFLMCERYLENIKILVGYKEVPLESWQLSLCASLPQVMKTFKEPLYADNNPVFKIHFYLIALVILLGMTHAVYGFTRMFREDYYEKIKPLIAQLVLLLLFVALCLLACFTAFYRTGTLLVPPISAVLMSVFFIAFGVTSGAYFGCLFYQKRALYSVIIPVVAAVATTVVMYLGELMLTGGVLYQFGTGWLFRPTFGTPFAIVDMLVVMLSGVITFGLIRTLAPRARSGSA